MKIETKDQLISYITSPYFNTLYCASRKHSVILKDFIDNKRTIMIGHVMERDTLSEAEFISYFDERGTYARKSLSDHNIDLINDYNDWYWFTTYESASRYSKS